MPYPFKNSVNPTYQDVMGSNIGVPSEDLIDFDNTDKAVNASSRLSEIDAEIARLKQRIAEKRAVENAYNRPASVYDYIIGGDRSGLDRIAQQKMAEEQAKQQRELTEKLSKDQKSEQEQYKRNEIANKYQLALTDFELAQQQVDLQKPETLARLKRAAQLANYYGTQLNFDNVSGEATEDAPSIKVNKAVSKVKALKRTNPKKWTNEQKQEYVDTMALIPDEDERKTDLIVDLENMPSTTEEQNEARNKRKAKWEEGIKLQGYDYRKWAESPEGKKLIAEFGEH